MKKKSLLILLKKEIKRIKKAKHKLFLPFVFIYSIYGGFFSIFLRPDMNIIIRYILAFIVFLILFSFCYYFIVYVEE